MYTLQIRRRSWINSIKCPRMISIIWIINLWCLYLGTEFNLEIFFIIPIPLWKNHVWDIMSWHSSFGRKQIQISRQIHRQGTNHNLWYLFIVQPIVCNFISFSYHSSVTSLLRNMVVCICIIHLYSHIITKFIHNLFKLAITFNVFNIKYCFVVMSH